MTLIVRGRIIYPKIAIPDPQGQNPKDGQPFVVISRDEEIEKGSRIQAVGITGELKPAPAEHYIPLPWGPTAKSGLRQKSEALCSWLIEISQDSVDVGKGYLRGSVVDEIVVKVLELHSIPQIVDDEDKTWALAG